MYGVVSLLDPYHEGMVKDLWTEFKTRFGVAGVSQQPVPHYSYHVASDYDLERLREVLAVVARELTPFTVRTSGLGIFTGANPVLFVPVLPAEPISGINRHLWSALEGVGESVSPYYHPEAWQPHITLGNRDIDHAMLTRIISLISDRDFSWTIPIDNLAVIGEIPDGQPGLIARFELSEQSL